MTDNRLTRLTETRDALRVAIQGCESMRDLAALSREYRATLAEIDELAPPAKEVDSVDEIAQRRTARRAGTALPARRAKQSG